ncbi:MAG: bifunctional diaminohydroxyphosphoribosylaminopyrimidine deaminase/5-amino-6-(5-phosphoribosylamino)uracil reductase RibD [Chitinophagaceae bacterium]|nr:bifunctional diaminohydroxyphosphoribosylaminopyrimidine deaminase/5-amino-6-(5-phosphoribosylamino)uracil reductase RibD [Chitinophagaceae bacterium]
MTHHKQYMQRCIQLAQKGAGYTAPNPMVGAVLVYDNMIIGEGWHQQYGEAHAEVNCIRQAIQNGHTNELQHSTLYVSLEPCAHFGKTPPCADLIIKHQLPKVVIGCRDPFTEVNGKGAEKLKAAGVEVTVGVLKKECEELNKRFFTFHQKQRPYIVLKWAQTKNKKIAAPINPLASAAQRLFICNNFTNRLVHQWRSEEASILVATNTALMDDPQLTNRYSNGKQPVRLLLDKELRVPSSAKLMNDDAATIIFNYHKHQEQGQPEYYKIAENASAVHQIINALYQKNIQSVLVEGGSKLLQSFIDEGLWDEARVITNEELIVDEGLNSPVLQNHQQIGEDQILSDTLKVYRNLKS